MSNDEVKALREEVAALRKQVEALALVLRMGPQFFERPDPRQVLHELEQINREWNQR